MEMPAHYTHQVPRGRNGQDTIERREHAPNTTLDPMLKRCGCRGTVGCRAGAGYCISEGIMSMMGLILTYYSMISWPWRVHFLRIFNP
jgi:hypothetical protein